MCSYIVELLCTVCFFFKQKTAYEMRISDWSSDVCSSDLEGPRYQLEQSDAERADGIGTFSWSFVTNASRPIQESSGFPAIGLEIGRASCRERVCQYV